MHLRTFLPKDEHAFLSVRGKEAEKAVESAVPPTMGRKIR